MLYHGLCLQRLQGGEVGHARAYAVDAVDLDYSKRFSLYVCSSHSGASCFAPFALSFASVYAPGHLCVLRPVNELHETVNFCMLLSIGILVFSSGVDGYYYRFRCALLLAKYSLLVIDKSY